jgi:cobalamin biosynthetic protein CobC
MNTVTSFEVFRVHGGKIEAARALFPQARTPWIDLSTGISRWAYPHKPIAPEAFTRLPDPESIAALEAAAAASFGVNDPACVIATPGSDLALRILGKVFTEGSVAVVRPGYSGHMLAWGRAPVAPVAADEIESKADTHAVLVLANPNNPDGRFIAPGRLLSIAARLAARDGALIVDEAFGDIVPGQSVCGSLRDGLVVFRSFGKFYGLAGLRLGFVVVSHAEQRRAFREALGDWPVSGPAVAVGTEAYADIEWQSAQRARLIESARRLDGLLTRAGLTVVGGTPLFRLARCEDSDALFRHLAAHGILTRPFSRDATLMRFGLPGADETHWQRLAIALTPRLTS